MAWAARRALPDRDLTRHAMRSADLRRLRASRPHAEPARFGVAALLRARGMARRTARAITSLVFAPTAGLAARSGLSVQPAPARREPRLRG